MSFILILIYIFSFSISYIYMRRQLIMNGDTFDSDSIIPMLLVILPFFNTVLTITYIIELIDSDLKKTGKIKPEKYYKNRFDWFFQIDKSNK